MTDHDANALRGAFRHCRAAFVGVALMSGLVNVLYLTGSFFMLEVYDRVIPGRSIPTLVGLCVLALLLYAFQGALEALRARILARIGAALDEAVSGRVFGLVLDAPLRGPAVGDGLLPLRDLGQVQAFLSGSGPGALFDLPWLPLYVAICFLFHPLIGAAAVSGAVVLVSLTGAIDVATRRQTRLSTLHAQRRHVLAEAGRRNAEALVAMGMREQLTNRWSEANLAHRTAQAHLADLGGGLGAVSKVFRMALQSGVLALGAWLVIEGGATSGIIIASSILVSRALAPAELAIANWKGFVAARQSWTRLSAELGRGPARRERHALPAPRACLSVEGVSIAPPGIPRLTVQDITVRLEAGQALGVIGPSASGKSSLVRALVGVWTPVHGHVRLDGASLDQWTSKERGVHVGYLPQEAELFAGTVAENIARLDPAADAQAVLAAAQAAGIHEMILRLPDGYDTQLGEGGSGLSVGQRQRVGLARALYGNPFLVVLDEPNANLDMEGEQALTRAILGVRARGGICIVVAHRPSALAAVDCVLMIADGRARAFGPRDEVLRSILRSAPEAAPPSKSDPATPSPVPQMPRAIPLEDVLRESA